MTWVFLIVFLGLVLIGMLALFCYWLFWTPGEDDESRQDMAKTLIRRMRIWLTRPTPKLSYRRDNKGRFRKIRRD